MPYSQTWPYAGTYIRWRPESKGRTDSPQAVKNRTVGRETETTERTLTPNVERGADGLRLERTIDWVGKIDVLPDSIPVFLF